MKYRVLLVDDDTNLLHGLRRALHHESYEILMAGGAMAALDILASRGAEVVVSDQDMPGMRGTEFLARVRASYPDTMRILLTGHATLEVAIGAINGGEVYRFLTKPCNIVELAVAIRQALGQRALVIESRRLLEMLRRQSAVMDELEGQVHGLTCVSRDSSGAVVIREAPRDLDALLKEVEAELKTGDERLRARERLIRQRGEQMLRERVRLHGL